jgi:tetratricopeptide (TPR) repeat protein
MKIDELKSLIVNAIEKATQLCNNKEYEVSLNFCNQILKIDKENSEAWFIKGICLTNIDKKEEAKEAFGYASQYTEIPENKEYAIRVRNNI